MLPWRARSDGEVDVSSWAPEEHNPGFESLLVLLDLAPRGRFGLTVPALECSSTTHHGCRCLFRAASAIFILSIISPRSPPARFAGSAYLACARCNFARRSSVLVP